MTIFRDKILKSMIHPGAFRTAALAVILAAGLTTACTDQSIPTDLSKEKIIPRPVSVAADGQSFGITAKTRILIDPGVAEAWPVAEYLSERIRIYSGLDLKVEELSEGGKGTIKLKLESGSGVTGEEGYVLLIDRKSVVISASRPAGLFYGVQTLLQLIPSWDGSASLEDRIEVATGTIRDYPQYGYRGAMLDVARHFFKPDDVRRFIDLMAIYKLNFLHLHLSDDQGWRIEIKSWPNLALVGGSTKVGGGAGGYYTQEEYAALVEYARSRFITVVPEIDMPGHTNSALASYAELNCNGKATKLYTGTEVGFSTLCPEKEITYRFITDVFRELASLTPGPFLHIGGDESFATPKGQYVPFIERVQGIVDSLGKRVIGWDDIAVSRMIPGAVAQHWANVDHGQKAAAQGARLIISPARKAYLDMKYDSTTVLGLKWAGYIEVDTAYLWNPAGFIPGVGKDQILGIEAPLWSETVSTMDEVEFMTFPRLPGYAEIGWTPDSLRIWDDYRERLKAHGARFEALDIDYYRSGKVW